MLLATALGDCAEPDPQPERPSLTGNVVYVFFNILEGKPFAMEVQLSDTVGMVKRSFQVGSTMRMYVCMYVHICIFVCMYVYIYIHIHIHTYVHTHTIYIQTWTDTRRDEKYLCTRTYVYCNEAN